MRESFTYGSVGRAPRKRCLYPEPDAKNRGVLVFWLHKNCKGYLNVYGKLLAQVTGAVGA